MEETRGSGLQRRISAKRSCSEAAINSVEKVRTAQDAWIQNSFVSTKPAQRKEHGHDNGDGLSVSRVCTRSGNHHTNSHRLNESKKRRLSSEKLSIPEDADVYRAGCFHSPLDVKMDRTSHSTSTPVSSEGRQKNACGNKVSAAIDTSEDYVSQHHESFNDNDSIFAEVDLGPGTATPQSVRRSSLSVGRSTRRSTPGPGSRRCKDKAEPRPLCKKRLLDLSSGVGLGSNTGDRSTNDGNISSDGSLFGDTDVTDEQIIRSSIQVKEEEHIGTTQRWSSNSEKTHEGQVNKSNLTTIAQDNLLSTRKRRSVEFHAASGSQLSITEEDKESTLSSKEGQLKTTETTHEPSVFSGSHTAQQNATSVTPRSSSSVPKPGSARLQSLKERLKGNLKSTSSPASRAAQLKASSLQKALREAEEVQAQSSEHDIGPFYGLPSKVSELLQQHRGIKSVYDWQHECLTLDAVREARNLIYSLPTSGGKTLVAELLILRELLCKRKDALLVLPFVAIVQEKVKGLTPFALDLDFVLEEYAGSKGSMPPRKHRKRKALYVATIEKASSLVNSLLEAERLSEIGLVVVDELHMLGEGGSRGAILEITLTKLLHASEAQVVGMSATLSNISDLSQFLKADVYSNDFRPVELIEYVKIEDTVYRIDPNALCPDDRLKHSRVCTFPYNSAMTHSDPDHLAGLVQEVIPEHSCLIFCPTKKNCENVAELLCRLLPRDMVEVKRRERQGLLKVLWHEGAGQLCPILRRTVPYGIAYHHSGLTMDERRLVEEAYLEGVLCLLTCTSTLAAGVNLPAKRVIIRAPNVGAEFLSRSQYKQMVGRAGRAGFDSSGESILILPKKDRVKLLDLVSGPCAVCRSSLLYENHKGMRRLLLATIGLKLTPTLHSVSDFLRQTLCFVQRTQLDNDVMTVAQGSLQQLVDLGLITQTVEVAADGDSRVVEQTYLLAVTRLGRAVHKGSIDMDRGPQLYKDLCHSQQSLVVANYLHLLYLVTPYEMVGLVKPDWMIYLDQFSRLEEHEMKVADLIGVPESYIAKKASGQRVRKTVDEFTVNRFYLTLMLHSLWKQQSIWTVSSIFRVPRGLLQNLLNSAATFAACISHFCQELEEFWAYQDLFGNFVKKLSFSFMTDLIPLMEIPGVKAGRARQLYKAGYKTLQQLAYAETKVLVKTIEHLSTKVAKGIITAAKVLLSDKVEALREEAEQLVLVPSQTAMDDTPVMGPSSPNSFSSRQNSQAVDNAV